MSVMNGMRDRVRAYPAGDAQGQHPAPVGNGPGLLHHPGRVQRKKLAREMRLRYASWNVGTMTGRARELADVLKRRRINVACLQETKWRGTKAREIGEGYKFYYCDSDGKRNGVGVVLDSKLKESVMEVHRMNDRIIVVKVMLENVMLNVVSVYAPQVGCNETVKEKFWEDFDTALMNIPVHEELIVGGDFNGHVGRMRGMYERVHGGWGFGNPNNEGETLLQSATAFDLAVANTWFQKKDEHLATYKSGNHKTQIDYFLVRRNHLKYVMDCKVLSGEDLVSQHRLLVMTSVVQIHCRKTKERPPPRIKWHRLERNDCAKKFRERVVDRMIEMGDMNDRSINESWNAMAECIMQAARDILGETKGKGRIDRDTWWWSTEVQNVLKEKKKKFKEWQCVQTDNVSLKAERKSEYDALKKKAKKAVAIAKAKAQDKLYDTLDSPAGQKELYRLSRMRERKARDVCQVRCVRDESGMVLSDNEKIKERWKEYFERLMNEENNWSGVLENKPVNVGLVRMVSVEEVRVAVNGMKNGKAIGPDGIPVEVWKLLRVDGWVWLALFFNKLLQEEAIPDEWCNSSLVPIFKNKGDVLECNNYRGIKLMSHTMKVWEKVIERRLREESEISQNQFGFMPGRGTTDAIFAIRQLCEKYRGAHKNLHMVFVDLEKAYDRVPREVLWWALKEKGVPGKYVQLIRSMYSRCSTQVRSAAGTTNNFNVAVGLHQGSALSPYLFLIIMDALTSDIQEEAPWCMLFADDIVLVAESALEVQSRLEVWWQRLESVGLKLSRTKTEYLFCDFGGLSSPVPIALAGTPIPTCSDFRYLGSLIQGNGEIDRDVAHRINSGWMKWRQVTGTTCDPRMPLKLKGKIYKSVIRPVLLYGSECWALKKTDEKRLHVAEMRMLRWMCGVTRMDKVRNEYIRGSLKVAPVTEKLRGNRLSWYGHVKRRDETHVTKKAMSMNVDGWRGRGRPKKIWMDCVRSDMENRGVSDSVTGDRTEWKKKTYCADPK
ncbi:hypothetical protein PYW08_009710 [Mythimna loreyi]|uniref:Uncharacterized protein n=3 Tax=Mythimna loreyi TaxID=667449 RepID=A0ACC2Q951_9NEOP|nr:hypothetical protein PYW08_009710 [Mythimna loreyi]